MDNLIHIHRYHTNYDVQKNQDSDKTAHLPKVIEVFTFHQLPKNNKNSGTHNAITVPVLKWNMLKIGTPEIITAITPLLLRWLNFILQCTDATKRIQMEDLAQNEIFCVKFAISS